MASDFEDPVSLARLTKAYRRVEAETAKRLALAQAIDAARDAIRDAQGQGLPADQVLEHAKRAALGHVAEADAERIAARLLQGEE